MEQAVDAANAELRRADAVAEKMAKLLVGRLRKISDTWSGHKTLAALKRELQDFNAQAARWKS